MADFERMYRKFKLDEKSIDHLVKLSSKMFPFDEIILEIPIKTIWSQNGEQKKIEKGVAHAKLV